MTDFLTSFLPTYLLKRGIGETLLFLLLAGEVEDAGEVAHAASLASAIARTAATSCGMCSARIVRPFGVGRSSSSATAQTRRLTTSMPLYSPSVARTSSRLFFAK